MRPEQATAAVSAIVRLTIVAGVIAWAVANIHAFTQPAGATSWLTIAAAFLASTATAVGLLALIRQNRKRIRAAEEDPSERLNRRIRHVNASFAEAVALTAELQRDLEARPRGTSVQRLTLSR
jgi:hypothetical protein